VERLLQQVADARHAGDRRDAMSQLSSLLQGNPRVGIWLNCNTNSMNLSTVHVTPIACYLAADLTTPCEKCQFIDLCVELLAWMVCRLSMQSARWASQCCCRSSQRTGMIWTC
jgi:hypothetical protein